jgi:hypothetical protein
LDCAIMAPHAGDDRDGKARFGSSGDHAALRRLKDPNNTRRLSDAPTGLHPKPSMVSNESPQLLYRSATAKYVKLFATHFTNLREETVDNPQRWEAFLAQNLDVCERPENGTSQSSRRPNQPFSTGVSARAPHSLPEPS